MSLIGPDYVCSEPRDLSPSTIYTECTDKCDWAASRITIPGLWFFSQASFFYMIVELCGRNLKNKLFIRKHLQSRELLAFKKMSNKKTRNSPFEQILETCFYIL